MLLTLDLTIKMQCQYLGADYIDVAGNSSDAAANFLKLEPAHFELAPNQKVWADKVAKLKAADGSRGLDSLQRFLHRDGWSERVMPPRDSVPDTPHDACRVHGALPINKVAGNFHITAGKSIHHARGHSHLVGMVPQSEMNFTHRFDRLSYSTTLEAHTLDGDMQVSTVPEEMFQYYLKVVPTSAQELYEKEPRKTYQYSVSENRRVSQTFGGGGGLPGIYVKYDLEPLCVHVKEKRRSLSQFLVRLCGIIGGIFATSGMLHALITATLGTVGSSTAAGESGSLPRASTDAPMPSSSSPPTDPGS